jgi:uncharacterized protein (DUF1778 family)
LRNPARVFYLHGVAYSTRKKEPSLTRSEIVAFKVTPAERALFRLAARSQGVSVSQFIREAANKHADDLAAERTPSDRSDVEAVPAST